MNPINENYFTQYFESTQAERNMYLSREQFGSIPWRHGLPQLLLEFLGIVTGRPEEIRKLFKEAMPIVKKLQDLNLRKAVATDNMTRKLYHDGRLEDELDQKMLQRNDSFDSTFSNDHPQALRDLQTKCRELKKEIGSAQVYKRLETSFKILAERRKRESKYISLYNITE